VAGEERELARTSAESASHAGADVVIWIREWEGDVSELKQLLAKVEAQVASQPPSGTFPHTSLWRQSRWHTQIVLVERSRELPFGRDEPQDFGNKSRRMGKGKRKASFAKQLN
jgi:hypothetical protein